MPQQLAAPRLPSKVSRQQMSRVSTYVLEGLKQQQVGEENVHRRDSYHY